MASLPANVTVTFGNSTADYYQAPCAWTFKDSACVDESPHTIDSLLKENEELRSNLRLEQEAFDAVEARLVEAQVQIAELRAELVAEPESAPAELDWRVDTMMSVWVGGQEIMRNGVCINESAQKTWDALNAQPLEFELTPATASGNAPERAEQISPAEVNLFEMLTQVKSKPRPEGVKPPLGSLLIGPTEEKYRGLGFCDSAGV